MASYVDIANLAVGYLGEDDQLRSPDDDTHVGRTVAAVWDLTRQAALRDYPFSFARSRAALAAESLPTAPIGWGYRFPLPPLCLRLIELVDFPEHRNFEIEAGALLWDGAGPLRVRFVRDVPETVNWDSLFVEMFARRLAWQVADRITGDRGRKADAWEAYKDARDEAKRANALEGPQRENDEPGEWELARGGWGSDAGRRAGPAYWGPYIPV